MDDLTKRLRQQALPDPHDERKVTHAPLLRSAADAIERLQARVAELGRERNLILAALPDNYTESKDWAFDKSPILRIEWLKSRIDNLKRERDLQDELLDALAEKVLGN